MSDYGDSLDLDRAYDQHQDALKRAHITGLREALAICREREERARTSADKAEWWEQHANQIFGLAAQLIERRIDDIEAQVIYDPEGQTVQEAVTREAGK